MGIVEPLFYNVRRKTIEVVVNMVEKSMAPDPIELDNLLIKNKFATKR